MSMYPVEITEEEKKLGFKVTQIDNPDARYISEPPKITAVVCRVGPSDRVVKIMDPGDQVSYIHHRFGKAPYKLAEESPSWSLCDDNHFYPELAVDIARSLLGKQGKVMIVPSIPTE